MIRALLIGALLVLPASAGAQPPTSAPSTPLVQVTPDQLNADLQRLAGRAAPQMTAILKVNELYTSVIGRVDQLYRLKQTRAPRVEIDKWLGEWEPSAHAQAATLRAGVKDWRAFTAEDAPLVFAFGDRMGLDVEGLRQIPIRNRDAVMRLLDQVDEIATAQHNAAVGGEAADQALRVVLVSSDGVVLESQSATLSLNAATQPPTSPTRFFLLGIVTANKAHLAFNKALAADVGGQKVDGPTVAAEMRRHIAEARGQTERVRQTARDMRALVARDPLGGKSTLATKEIAMLATYDESADTEDAIDTAYDRLAASLADGMRPLAVAANLDALVALQQKRGEIINRRYRIAGQ